MYRIRVPAGISWRDLRLAKAEQVSGIRATACPAVFNSLGKKLNQRVFVHFASSWRVSRRFCMFVFCCEDIAVAICFVMRLAA